MGLSDREAEPIALRFLAHGYHAFVLRYSVQSRMPAPILDLASAVACLRRNAPEWFIDPQRIAVCGFSAGGHLAASLGVFWDKPFIYEPLGLSPEQIRPSALLLCYAVIELEVIVNRPFTLDPSGQPAYDSQDAIVKLLGDTRPTQAQRDQYRLDLQVSPATAPAFIWHTANDQVVPAHNALRFAAALARQQVPYELHIFENGVHGLALADAVTEVSGRFINPENQIWVDLALKWLKRMA
jgi:acetyl esterase/lipase